MVLCGAVVQKLFACLKKNKYLCMLSLYLFDRNREKFTPAMSGWFERIYIMKAIYHDLAQREGAHERRHGYGQREGAHEHRHEHMRRERVQGHHRDHVQGRTHGGRRDRARMHSRGQRVRTRDQYGHEHGDSRMNAHTISNYNFHKAADQPANMAAPSMSREPSASFQCDHDCRSCPLRAQGACVKRR